MGKEVTIIENTTTTITISGETQTETEERIYTHVVEGIEDITVPAGTFRCFKVVEYNEQGNIDSIDWYADKAKVNVKSIDHETGDIMELQSYSVR